MDEDKLPISPSNTWESYLPVGIGSSLIYIFPLNHLTSIEQTDSIFKNHKAEHQR